jgi:Icc-related predicted phosphoesterase
MRLLLTSDLHQRIEKWSDLVAGVRQERPRFVLIAGDLLPKVDTSGRQKRFFDDMRRFFRAIMQEGPITILTYLGNDDAHVLEPLLDQLEAEGLCINLNGRVHREEGLVFCGMNRVRDYPFGYKHWCARDGDYVASASQFCGEGLTLNERGELVPLDNLVAYLSAKPSVGDALDQLCAQLRPGEMERSVWMVHQPPAGLGMDICGDGREVGSPTVSEFIRVHQPLLGCSGHIHESPYQKGGRWIARQGRTVWVQAGQMGSRLHYVRAEVAEACAVADVRHSVFGPEEQEQHRPG